MSFRNSMFFNYDHTFPSPPPYTNFPPTVMNQFSSNQFHTDYQSNVLNFPVDFFRSNLLSPYFSEYNSHSNDSRISQSTYSYHQSIMNLHEGFLNRNPTNCLSHLSSKKQNKWQKTEQKAQHNQHLLSSMDHFYSHATNSDPPVYIHHRTPETHLQGLLFKIKDVHLFTINTESDKTTRQYPHSVPTSLQIQAIHEEHFSTIFIIELQRLPHSSTSLFRLIQTLCHQIFSSTNIIMAWEDVHKELKSFEQFNLFDLSIISNSVNLQTKFTNYWNVTHPHTPECLIRHQPELDEPESDDILVCLINSNDINSEFDSMDINSDYNSCICPNEIRPYKSKNSIWSLQRAIQFVFHTRESLTTYAIKDLIASTDLYFYMTKTSVSSSNINSSTQLNSVPHDVVHNLPNFLILSDSHGKYFPPTVTTPKYKLITKPFSGLQWANRDNPQLCTSSLLLSSSISSILSTCTGVLFLIGTNSIRNTFAYQIIEQVDDIIHQIRFQHPHLIRKTDITIVSVFPCFKSSSLFPCISLLLSNLNHYNNLIKELASSKNFTVLDLPVTDVHLSHGRMHVHLDHLPFLWDAIQRYFNDSVSSRTQSSHTHRRTRIAITLRNKKRHDKMKQRRLKLTVMRPIARVWQLSHLKAYLKYKQIKFSRLPEIHHHQLRIQFHNTSHYHDADTKLSHTDFDERSYHAWISSQQ